MVDFDLPSLELWWKPISQELSKDVYELGVPSHADGIGDEEWLEIRSAHDEPVFVLQDNQVSTVPNRVTANCPMAG